MVLVFPIAWALLGRSRPYAWRVAMVLVACVAGWSLWTVTLGTYGSAPNVDDGVRWYLVVAGVVVAAATVVERHPVTKRWVAGALGWIAGVAVIFAIPVVGDEQVPPRDAVLPLPAAMSIVHEEAGCVERSCVRPFTIAATDGANVRDLARRLGEYLQQTQDFPARRYDFTPTPDFECRRTGWLNPYELCVELRLDEGSTVRMQLAYKTLLEMQEDGNLVVYDEYGVARWAATWTRPDVYHHGDVAVFQNDGNFVVYDWDQRPAKAYWASNTCCMVASLAIQADGNVVIYNAGDVAQWSTNSYH